MAVERASVALLKKLRPRWRKFVRNLAADPLRNAARAYEMAGFNVDKDNRQSVANAASRLLARVEIWEAYTTLRDELRTDHDVTEGDIVKELSRIAFARPSRLFDADGKRREIHQLEEDEEASVREMEYEHTKTRTFVDSEERMVVEEEGLVKVKLHDKVGALKTLAGIKGLIKQTHKHEGTLKLEDIVARAARPAEGTE